MNILLKYGSWPVIIWHYCVYTESQYVSVRHTVENGYVRVSNLLSPVHCMSSCYVARLFGVYFFLCSTRFD